MELDYEQGILERNPEVQHRIERAARLAYNYHAATQAALPATFGTSIYPAFENDNLGWNLDAQALVPPTNLDSRLESLEDFFDTANMQRPWYGLNAAPSTPGPVLPLSMKPAQLNIDPSQAPTNDVDSSGLESFNMLQAEPSTSINSEFSYANQQIPIDATRFQSSYVLDATGESMHGVSMPENSDQNLRRVASKTEMAESSTHGGREVPVDMALGSAQWVMDKGPGHIISYGGIPSP